MTFPVGAVAVLVVIGVSGSGKSTVAAALADTLGWDFIDADDLHSPANVTAMSAGRELTDADRAPWLAQVAEHIHASQRRGRSCVIACSALKRQYRDALSSPGVLFVQLHVDADEVRRRVRSRTAHFMPVTLVGSQFAALEPLEPDENGVQIESAGPVAHTVRSVLAATGLAAPD